MRTQRRVPTIFSLSMLDVLCCGLGAVILLMIVNYWDARRQASHLVQARARVGLTSQQLADAQKELSATQATLREAQAELKDIQARLLASNADLRARLKEREQLLAQLKELEAAARATKDRLAQTEHELSAAVKDLLSSREQQATAQADLAMLTLELTDQQKRLAALQDLLQRTESQRADAEAVARLVPGLKAELSDAQKRLKEAMALAGLVPTLRQERDSALVRVKEMEADLAALRKQADAMGLKLVAAEKQARTVQVEVDALRKLLEGQRLLTGQLEGRLAAAENRFAGVDLSGRRVVLLVDLSGSMGSIDYQTSDPNKWPEVRRTVVQVLRSLPEVEKYQVIVFADAVQFPLGRAGQWLDFDREQSPAELDRALARLQPKGNTNMYVAFEAAFRYRVQGLDTIFLFSDGLPNLGPGLPNPPPRDEAAQAALLGKYVRETIQTRWNTGQPRVKIHAVGFFYESSNLGAFLWALSRENGGSFVGMARP
jgi:septal ring factor EnvC (AmiA/AmiB activator)